uniref:p5 n=1 Tax=Emaravirus rosae TaxID=1980433 RepID=A0A6C0VPV4_9VIRU|nr:p5 [Emaravirus rosae]QIB98151.1 p5 [Emaravirus rosae]QIB98154.1 p5 [Emaravirus rosae]QIB98178.1 p5 [Emaravirus rosae]
MEKIIPYVRPDPEKVDFSNHEKLPKLSSLGDFYGPIYKLIRENFNSCNCIEKKLFYGEYTRIPCSSSIGYIEINRGEMPTVIATVLNRGTVRLEVLPEDVVNALKSIVYNYVIENYENLEMVTAVIKNAAAVRNYFIMVKIIDKQWIINETKKNWANIIGSTYLAQKELIISHYLRMKSFYYRIVCNLRYEKSVYSFIDENKHLSNEIIPSLDIMLRTYNIHVFKYVKEHIQYCKKMLDYDIPFDCNKINESDFMYGEFFPLDVKTAIYEDVTIRLREVKIENSEVDVLKKPIIEYVDKEILLNDIALNKAVDEKIKYLPGDNEIEDMFYYGLPGSIKTVVNNINSSMKKNISDDTKIDDIDYIPNYPFKSSYKKEIYNLYKLKNSDLKMSHLTLHYICLYLYIAKVSAIRTGYSENIGTVEVLERAREFAKVNVSHLRSRLLFLHQNRISIKDGCMQIFLKVNWTH